jgi:hypothetical protein
MNISVNIHEWSEKIKSYFRLAAIVLVAFIFLGFWQLKAEAATKTPLKVVNLGQNGLLDSSGGLQTVIGSKSGSKYYYPWCAGALARTKPENRVEFASPALAMAAGYSPAGNCKGLK